MSAAAPASIRLDKWLWHARFFRSRSLAAKAVAEGRVRINAQRTDRPARAVVPGDVLTFAQGDRVRVVRVLAPGTRRGPAAEAALLFDDLAPEASSAAAGPDGAAKCRRTPLD